MQSQSFALATKQKALVRFESQALHSWHPTMPEWRWVHSRTCKSLFFFKFIYLFWERDRERKHEGLGQREREIDSIPSRLHAICAEPDLGLKLMNCEIMAWAKIKSRMLNWLNHPGAPASLDVELASQWSRWLIGLMFDYWNMSCLSCWIHLYYYILSHTNLYFLKFFITNWISTIKMESYLKQILYWYLI